MFLNVLRHGGSIWSDGVGPIDAFKKGIRSKLRAERGVAEVQKGVAAPPPPPPAPPTIEQLAAQLAPADVLAGPYGDAIKRAAADRALDARHHEQVRRDREGADPGHRTDGGRLGAARRRRGDDAASSRRRRLRRVARRVGPAARGAAVRTGHAGARAARRRCSSASGTRSPTCSSGGGRCRASSRAPASCYRT